MKSFRNYSKSVSLFNGIYILSAARTPVGLVNGVLSDFTAPQLVSFAIKEALQRAVVPSKDLQNVFLECASHDNCHEEVIKRTGLCSSTNVSWIPTCGMKSVLEAAKFLFRGDHKVCLSGGMESVTHSHQDGGYLQNFINDKDTGKCSLGSVQEMNRYSEEDYKNFIEANRSGAFYEEMLKIDFRKKGQRITVEQDEILKRQDLHQTDSFSPVAGDGAAAVIISTEDYAKRSNLVPLAEIISFAEESTSPGDLSLAQHLAIEKCLKEAKCEGKDVARWEVSSLFNDVVLKCRSYFDLNSSKVNKDGGLICVGYPPGMSGVRSLCHLVHSLHSGEIGCATGCDFSGTATAVIVKKLSARKSGKAQLTLYTKHPCPLCDELKLQLKPFEGRFSLEEVDIETKEGGLYKELYQYEIPVLFLDGIFLCKHKLHVDHFERRLSASEMRLT